MVWEIKAQFTKTSVKAELQQKRYEKVAFYPLDVAPGLSIFAHSTIRTRLNSTIISSHADDRYFSTMWTECDQAKNL